jgi:hypothetical protein
MTSPHATFLASYAPIAFFRIKGYTHGHCLFCRPGATAAAMT